MYTDEYKSKVTPGVYESIQKCREGNINSQTIIFTDSAGAQLYNVNDSTSNGFFVINGTRAYGLVGQYLLINELVRNHPDEVKGNTIYLVTIPSVFMDNLDQVYTFNYFIKPFYNEQYIPYLEDKVKTHIESFPMQWASQLPLVKTTNWSVDYSNAKSFFKIDEYYISEFSLIYLNRLKELADEFGFEFVIKAPFMRNDKKEVSQEKMKQQIREHNLDDIFRHYFEDMKYIPDSVFVDRDHFDTEKYKPELNSLKL
jgi:hypothetical protein